MMQQRAGDIKNSLLGYDSGWFGLVWCALEVLNFLPLTYNGEVMKLTWPEVTDMKNPRYTNRRYLPMSVLHTASFKEFESLMCLWQTLKLWKMQLEVRSLNVTWRRDLWGHRVIVFWKCAKLLAEQLWQTWRLGSATRRRFFAICEKPEGKGRIPAPRPCAG